MRKANRESQVQRTMRLSVIEGIFAQIYASLVTPGCVFITKFAYLLKATPLQFSLLSAISQFAQLFQLLGVVISRKFTARRRITVVTAGISRALTLFLGIALAVHSPHLGIWVMLAILLVSAAISSISGNIWIAWIADSIPLSIRGRFFSIRSQILLVFGLVVGYAFSFLVDCFHPIPGSVHSRFVEMLGAGAFFNPAHEGAGLNLIFIVGTILGLVGMIFLQRQPERMPKPHAAENTASMWEPLADPNFRRLLLFGVWWMLAIGIGSPFWQPFMIGVLGMSTVQVVLYGTLQSLSMLFWYRIWGKYIDRFGNKSLMKVLIIQGGINPMFWLFASPSGYGIIWCEALLSGAMWSGAGLVATNFVLAIAPNGKEQTYAGLYAAITGIAMMLSMILSGCFFPAPLRIFGLILTPEQVLFGLTGLARWSAEIPLQFVYEPRGTSLRKSFYLINQSIMSRFTYMKNWMNRRFGE